MKHGLEWRPIVVAVVLVIVLSGLFALATKWIFNYVLSEECLVFLFGGPLDFWKAFWINLAAGIFFKNTSPSSKKAS